VLDFLTFCPFWSPNASRERQKGLPKRWCGAKCALGTCGAGTYTGPIVRGGRGIRGGHSWFADEISIEVR